MKRFRIFAVLLIILTAAGNHAQADSKNDKAGSRRVWNTELRNVKTDYVAAKLDLTADQREKFASLYTSMESEIRAVNTEARNAIDSVKAKGKAATDADYRHATRIAFDVKSKEAAIEKRYMTKFQQILTPAQLFALKDVETQFMKELMKKHGAMKKSQRKQPAKKQ